MREISSGLLVLVPAPLGVDGVVCVTVCAKASPNGGIRRNLPLAWGLVDGHILDTLPHMGMQARILPASPRHQALGLLLRCVLDERAQLLVSAAPLGRRFLLEPFQQGHRNSDVLACLGEARGILIIFEDPPIYIVGGSMQAPSIPTASNLSLEFGTLLFYQEVRLLELLLPLPQLLEPRGWWGLVPLLAPSFGSSEEFPYCGRLRHALWGLPP
jgi:hypothetical protein